MLLLTMVFGRTNLNSKVHALLELVSEKPIKFLKLFEAMEFHFKSGETHEEGHFADYAVWNYLL